MAGPRRDIPSAAQVDGADQPLGAVAHLAVGAAGACHPMSLHSLAPIIRRHVGTFKPTQGRGKGPCSDWYGMYRRQSLRTPALASAVAKETARERDPNHHESPGA